MLGISSTRVQRIVLELSMGQPVVIGIEMLPDKGETVEGVFSTVVKRHHVAEDGGLVEASE